MKKRQIYMGEALEIQWATSQLRVIHQAACLEELKEESLKGRLESLNMSKGNTWKTS